MNNTFVYDGGRGNPACRAAWHWPTWERQQGGMRGSGPCEGHCLEGPDGMHRSRPRGSRHGLRARRSSRLMIASLHWLRKLLFVNAGLLISLGSLIDLPLGRSSQWLQLNSIIPQVGSKVFPCSLNPPLKVLISCQSYSGSVSAVVWRFSDELSFHFNQLILISSHCIYGSFY